MEVTRQEFAKVLQDNESRIYWQSGKDAPAGVVVHEWYISDSGKLLACEIQHDGGSMYYIRPMALRG